VHQSKQHQRYAITLSLSTPNKQYKKQNNAHQTEIAYFEIAICVYKQIRWLQVSVDDPGGMNMRQPSQQLIRKEPNVLRRQQLRRTHQLV
jgi:hypothetical protein